MEPKSCLWKVIKKNGGKSNLYPCWMEVLIGTLRNLCGNGGFSNQKKSLLSSILDDFLLVQALEVLVVIDVQQAVDCGRNGLRPLVHRGISCGATATSGAVGVVVGCSRLMHPWILQQVAINGGFSLWFIVVDSATNGWKNGPALLSSGFVMGEYLMDYW